MVFTPELHRKRRRQLRRKLKNSGLDSLLVTDETNVRYLTGFTGDSSYLLTTPDRDVLLSDSRYTIQLEEECADLEREIRTAQKTLLQLTVKVVKQARLQRVGFESSGLSKATYDSLSEQLPRCELVATSDLIEQLRSIKDKSEIQTIRESIRIAQRAFEVVRAELRLGQTELEIAHNLEHTIRRFGGTRCSFDPIVGVGPRGALPHGRPSDLQVGSYPFLLIDWGAQFCGYASDLTRILVTGRISPKLERVYNVVLMAQLAAISKLRPGAKLREVDRAARKVIETAGHSRHFGHGLGHGFGLQIHEKPLMSPSSSGTLKAGMVVTVEPGIYLPDWGGVRIEDDVLITPEGHEVLTSTPKDLGQCVVDVV